METVLLSAQLVATAGLAGWLTTGVLDNLLHPSINETYTAEVMSMIRMREEYPEAYRQVAHRAVTSRRVQVFAFRTVVAAELVATLLLWVGTGMLLLSIAGAVPAETARTLATLGATAFLMIWSAFLIVGNYFGYWFCHEGAQNTHYQMTLWGLGVLILLTQG